MPAHLLTRRLFALGSAMAAVAIGGLGADEGAKPTASTEAKPDREKPQPQALLLIEPSNMRSEVAVLVPGARRTVYSAARPGRLGAKPYRRAEFRTAFPGGWKAFFAKGRAAAAAHLKTLKPKYRRDAHQVIEYAILESDHPLTATTIIAPGFRALFAETLGENLLIAVPSRSTVLVFPQLAGNMPDFYAVLADLYKDAIYPGSTEIFELTKEGIRVVGAFKAN